EVLRLGTRLDVVFEPGGVRAGVLGRDGDGRLPVVLQRLVFARHFRGYILHLLGDLGILGARTRHLGTAGRGIRDRDGNPRLAHRNVGERVTAVRYRAAHRVALLRVEGDLRGGQWGALVCDGPADGTVGAAAAAGGGKDE